MNKKILFKNIVLFLFPLLIPVFILGSFAIIITDKYMKESISSNNLNTLQQLEQQTNTVLNEMHLLHLDYNWNADMILSLQNILDSNYLTFEQKRNIEYGEGTLRRKEIATPYIHSIYVYYTNRKNRLLTSRSGVTTIDSLYDKSWFTEYNPESKEKEAWIRTRQIAQFPFEKPEPVITIYKNIFKTNAPASEGLIVLNVYQNYFEDLMNELNNYHNQSIFVVDQHDNKLYGNSHSEKWNIHDLLSDNDQETYELEIGNKEYIVNQLYSEEHDLRYFSVIEKRILYYLPNQLRFLTFAFVLLSLLLGVATIYYLSRKNARHVSDIISIINTTKQKEEELIENISFKDNEYQLIVRRILKNYIDQNNLEQELKDKKYQLQSAELLALQNQINPHFLSNTLAVIYWRAMALTGKPNKVTKMLETLTDVLNFSLRIKNHTVTLEEEIKNTKNYLEILSIRSDKAFNVHWDYAEEDKEVKVLKFVLQPIIENCLQHGMDYEKQHPEVQVKIKIRLRHHNIRFTIIDNGQGMNRSNLQKLRHKIDKNQYTTDHIGLANIQKRLSLIFNGNYRFLIRSKKGLGTVVIIEHPVDQDGERLDSESENSTSA
ncbi:two-component system, sensor histidine kinase YesM [Gracilibacillus ureilyticus]|uniref:Two-component system, sensor histidine kinase YesM n=1 Tax=Gracilibacillus ureilyticus TaxID=531814 RepID=A0A1H9UK24_9BACI|nr:sensor histidine kinase [Gracilibacillus ureilyticus]SES09786.1 two-component system, sensor histidine kinase YesM [Gracilibacillus ureilyticus]